MSDLVINETRNDLIVSGQDNKLDVLIEQHDLTVNTGNDITVSPIEVNLELRTDDVSLEIVEKSVDLLTVGIQGPAGPPGAGGVATLQTIFEQINDDNGYRGDAALGALTSEPVWQIRKIVILGDGTPDELFADSDDGFIHIWDDRAGLNY